MKHLKNMSAKRKITYVLFSFIAVVAGIFGIANLKADQGDTPSHAKRLTSNGDGTYQLSLDVTGDSVSEVGKANVIVIMDVSGSMGTNTGNTEVVYTPTTDNGDNLYGQVDGNYIRLTRTGRGANSRYWYQSGGRTIEYTGTRYTRQNANETRLEAAQSAVKSLSSSLLSNNVEGHEDAVQIALVTFSTTASTVVDPTTSYDDIESAIDAARANGGTNWEAALNDADDINFGDNDPTYVIFVSDGNPTFRVTSHTGNRLYNNGTVREYNVTNPDEYYYSNGWQERRSSNTGTGHLGTGSSDYYHWNYSDAAVVAKNIVDSGATLYSIGAYGEVDVMEDLAQYAYDDEAQGTAHYYNASDTAALQSALNAILEEIETSGIGEVSLTDGTTSSVKASSGTVNLLKVDESSYKYWLSMEVTKNDEGNYVNNSLGSTITFTGTDSNSTGTWTDRKGDHTINGEIVEVQDPDDPSKTKTMFRMQWTGANDLQDDTPPTAQLVTDSEGNESVDWDLSSIGVLLNGVTYTVTFDVWPTQYTYDLIADLENGVVQYSDLASSSGTEYAGLDEYITKVGDKYFLETNTTATLKYKDTRDENPEFNYSNYVNPPSVETDVDKIDIIKKWENDYDGTTGNPIDIIVNRDTGGVKDEFYRANLNINNDYTVKDVNIATGLMRLDRETGEVKVLEDGHDYSFEEENGSHYKWEFVTQTVHPMLINGELKELILLDEAATSTYTNDTSTLETYTIPEGMSDDDDYYDDGTYEYIRIDGKLYVITGAKPTVKAFNYRRSNLNLNKVVDGEAADSETKFEFKITVSDPGLENDENLWFSVFENGSVVLDDLGVSGWEAELDDEGNPTGFYFAPQGTELTVNLKVGQNLRFTNLTTQATYTIIETGKENYVFTSAEGSADYGKDHEAIDYEEGTDYEVDTDNNTVTGSITMTNSTFAIEVTNTYELASIDVTKIWDDEDDQDGFRPDDISVQVYRQIGENGTPSAFGDPVTIDAESANPDDENEWNYTIESVVVNGEETNLPRYDAQGNEYIYTIEEAEIAEYDTTIDPEGANQTDGKASYTITNTHVPYLYHENGELEVTKIWDDYDNEDGLRQEVTIELYINGEASGQTITLGIGDNPSDKFTNLPMYADGVEIEYTIVETTELEGYEDPEYDMDTPGSFTVTNKHVPLYNEDGVLQVTKIWDDVQNVDELRQDVTIELYIDGVASGQTITLTTTDTSSASFTDLPKYNEDGSEIEYTIVETTELEGYEDPEYDMDTPGSFTVTNVHIPLYNEDGVLEVTKIWDDYDNEDGLRQDVTIELYIDGEASGQTITLTTEDNSSASFTNLPKYNADGSEIEYTIVETTELEGYEDPEYDMDTPGSFTVTNKHVPLYNEDGVLEVTKIWDDYSNEDGLRQDVTIELYIDGEASGQTITLTTTDTSTASFTNLPKYNEDGSEIEYTIVETTELEGYEDPEYDMDTPGSFTVTNVHIPLYNEDGVLDVTKIWDDVQNVDELRQDVTIELYIDGVASGQTITLTTTDTSTTSFTNLPKYNEDGDEIEYTIVETTELEGYEDPEYDMDKPGSFTVTNKHVPLYNEDGVLEVTKIWDDFDNDAGLRQDVTIELYIDGEASGQTITLTTEDNSSASFTNLPKYNADGSEIEYTIVETTELEDYEDPEYDMDTPGSFTVTNIYTPLYNKDGELEVTKIWDDFGNEDGLRQDVTIELYIDGEASGQTITLTTTDTSSAKFTDLPKFNEDGSEIEYTIVETTELEGYEDPEYDMDTPGKFTVTNKHMPLYNKDGVLEVTKIWDDNDNYDGLRQDVTIELYIDGEASGQTITLTTEDNSSAKFTDLPKYNEDGDEIEYTIVETTSLTAYEDPEYDMDTPGSFTVTNKHEVVPVSFDITKNWADNANQDGKRTSSITINIFADGEFLKQETIDGDVKEDVWTYTVEGLDRYNADGDEIEYTITEEQVAEYEKPLVSGTAEDGFTIINTHNPSQISISGKKTWDHTGNKYGTPESVTIVLNRSVGDEVLDPLTKTVTAEDNWEYSWDELDEYKDGTIIVYSIDEQPVLDYTGTVNGYDIHNVYTPETYSINGVKHWDDAQDQDGKRPGTITVKLWGNGEVVQTKEVSGEGDDWSFTFDDVIKYANGVEIEYSITEEGVDSNYEAEITDFTITNHHTPEQMTYIVTKNWDDYNNADQIRPDSINVTLYKTVNGVRSAVKTFVISAENDWTYTFTDLPRYEGGYEITYDVIEDAVQGYANTGYDNNTTITDDGKQQTTTINNTETMNIDVTKLWDDSNDYDRIRPGYITVNLYANGSLVRTFEIYKEDDWKYTIEGLLKYQNGVLIEYKLEEEAVPGYVTTIDGYIITNTHEIKEEKIVEEMPPKTGVEASDTNYLFLILVTLAAAFGAFAGRIKKVFVQA